MDSIPSAKELLHIRLIGIDAPERDEKCYTEAKEYLNGMILHKVVNLEMDITDKDQYGRSLSTTHHK